MNTGSRVVAVLALATFAACGGGGGSPGAPVEVLFVAGADQSAPVGTALPVDPAVQVRDDRQRPVPGVTVLFTALNAAVLPASAVTGADGIARTRLTVATLTGIATVTAQVEGVGFTTLGATVLPGPVASIEKLQGDRQVAAPGAAVAVEPRVRVRDGFGNLAAGAAIACAVEAGGGSVAGGGGGGTAGIDGTASCGAWTLGTARGEENVLRVSAGPAPAQRFVAATAVRTSTELSLALSRTLEGAGTSRVFTFRADPISVLQVASATLRLAGRTLAMAEVTLRLGQRVWLADVAERELARGTYLARATAVDAGGAEADAVLWVDVDHLPVVTVIAPLPGSLASPSIAFEATCTDDDPAGCARFGVSSFALGRVRSIASGTASVSGTVDLSELEDLPAFLSFTGTDSAGQIGGDSREVFVETSPDLSLAATADGPVLDWDGARLLHRSGADGVSVTEPGGATARIATSVFPGPGFLVPGGAVVVDRPFSDLLPKRLLAWPGTGDAAEVAEVTTLRVAGDFALYRRRPDGALVRREVGTGAEVVVSAAADEAPGDVAANGDVVLVEANEVVRFRAGASTPLTSGSTARLNLGPVTDGARVVWAKGGRLAVFDGAEALGAEVRCPVAEGCYAVAGPWIAWQRPEDPAAAFTPIHVWRLGTAGEAQVDLFAGGARLEALLSDGTAILRTEQEPVAGRRWRAAPGGAPVQVGTGLGRVVERGGKAYVLLGRSVLELAPPAPPAPPVVVPLVPPPAVFEPSPSTDIEVVRGGTPSPSSPLIQP
jgi:hypothetical protein